MPMHIPPTIDTDPGRIGSMFPRLSPIAKSLPPATQSDILGILQREQDRAMDLLSSSPLLASLFVSYANQAAALGSDTPSTESEEWKVLEDTISRLQEEVDKLKPENAEMKGKLEAAAASQEAFRSQISALKDVNATQQDDIKSLREELLEAKSKYDRLLVDSNAEKAALEARVSDAETQRTELKEAVVEQQIKISRFERQSDPSSIPRPAGARKLATSEGGILASVWTRTPVPQSDDEDSILLNSSRVPRGFNDKSPTIPRFRSVSPPTPTGQRNTWPPPAPVTPKISSPIHGSISLPTPVEGNKQNQKVGDIEITPTLRPGRKNKRRGTGEIRSIVVASTPPTPTPEGEVLGPSPSPIPTPSTSKTGAPPALSAWLKSL